MFEVKTTVDAASELVTTSDAKAHLYITHSDDDTYLGTLITKARKQIENYCHIAIGSQTKRWTFDSCYMEETPFPYPPVISITSAKQKTDVDTYDTLTNGEDYETDGDAKKIFQPYADGRFQVTYVTGYTTLPEELKQAILIQIAYLYENRSSNVSGLCEMAKDLCQPFVEMSWI